MAPEAVGSSPIIRPNMITLKRLPEGESFVIQGTLLNTDTAIELPPSHVKNSTYFQQQHTADRQLPPGSSGTVI